MQALEVATLKLSLGLTVADFIAANADVDAWLLKQPGFVSCRIAEREDGAIIDALVWASVRDGKDGAARLTVERADWPVHAAIDQTRSSGPFRRSAMRRTAFNPPNKEPS